MSRNAWSRPREAPPLDTDDHILGPANASLVLIEYGDYECPRCGQVYRAVERLRQTLRKELRLAFRNFPRPLEHPRAMDAARAAEAAAMQGSFWEMHGLLLENQESLEPESLLEFASDLNLDVEQFESDLSRPSLDDRIARDIRGALDSGVIDTPAFFINGVLYEAEGAYEALLAALLNAKDARSHSTAWKAAL